MIMDLSVLFLLLGIFCWGTTWYLANCCKKVISRKTRIIRFLLIFSVVWLIVNPVDFVTLVGDDIEGGLRVFLNYFGTFAALAGGAFVVMGIFYPLLSFIFQCEMDDVLKEILS